MKLTLRDVGSKSTIISLKEIKLEDFNDEEATLEDLAAVILDALKEQGSQLIRDEDTGEIKDGWEDALRDYIDSEF
jgi:hypothetical protein